MYHTAGDIPYDDDCLGKGLGYEELDLELELE